MFKRIISAVALACIAGAATAGQAELVMVAPTNQTMPFAQFQNGALVGGIIKQFGDALAARLGRTARYVSLASGEVTPGLAQRKADGICYVMPFWIDGDYDWSRPLFPDAELVAANVEARRIGSLTDLRNKPIGTVKHYRYPRVETVLGENFARVESANIESSLRKVMAGEIEYTIIGRLTMDYQMRINKKLQLRPDLVFSSFKAMCAFVPNGKIPFRDVDRAINALAEDGSVERILAQYR